ncbi:DUF2087 domain-containing protein [Paenibacillus hodogayensis]|uniref:DUF2087 domain-containing protein n=1 Tax=Paenibacillus hodogayensis TaxID=279208 RepID=A0ABV5W294_9BACL
MSDVQDKLWDATIEEIKQGYVYEEETDHYHCLVCGEQFEKGVVYPVEQKLYEAGKAAAHHVAEAHGSMFDYLLQLDKKLTGLSDLQKQLLRLFYAGVSDRDIVTELNGGSASTIRNHRFMLREKEKQAKLFLVMMELLNDRKTVRPKPLSRTPRAGSHLDEQYAITDKDRSDIISKYFPEGPSGRLTEFPRKDKRKIVILAHLIERFERGRTYSEKQLNEILQAAYPDYVTLRRYLIDFGFMERRDDGSEYWLKEQEPGNMPMGPGRGKAGGAADVQQAGVFMLVNRRNGKMFVESSSNMRGTMNRIRFGLQTGVYDNRVLQSDWTEHGEEAFAFEVLDVWQPETDTPPTLKEKREQLKRLERRRLEELQPFGERGYNKEPAD